MGLITGTLSLCTGLIGLVPSIMLIVVGVSAIISFFKK